MNKVNFVGSSSGGSDGGGGSGGGGGLRSGSAARGDGGGGGDGDADDAATKTVMRAHRCLLQSTAAQRMVLQKWLEAYTTIYNRCMRLFAADEEHAISLSKQAIEALVGSTADGTNFIELRQRELEELDGAELQRKFEVMLKK